MKELPEDRDSHDRAVAITQLTLPHSSLKGSVAGGSLLAHCKGKSRKERRKEECQLVSKNGIRK